MNEYWYYSIISMQIISLFSDSVTVSAIIATILEILLYLERCSLTSTRKATPIHRFLQPNMKHLYIAVQEWLTHWRFKIFWLRYLEEKYLEDGSSKLPGTSLTIYQPTQRHIPKDFNLHQCSYENLVSHTIIQLYQLAKTVCTCLPLQMTNLMTGSNVTLCSKRICMASESSL